MTHTDDKCSAAKWAYYLLDNKNFVVLDTETTGLGGDVIQVAVINHEGEPLLNEFIYPTNGKVEPEAQKVHGISLQALEGKPTFDKIFTTMSAVISDKIIIAFNADFDRRILAKACRQYNLPLLTNTWECAMLRYGAYDGTLGKYNGYKWWKLVEATKNLNLEVKDAHDALGDVIMTLNLIKEMAKFYLPYVYFV